MAAGTLAVTGLPISTRRIEMAKRIDIMVPVEVTINDDGTTRVEIFTGDVNALEVFDLEMQRYTDDDAYELLDSHSWDDLKLWYSV